MTIYSDFDETTDYSDFSDPTDELTSVTGGCCCGPDAGAEDVYTPDWEDDYSEETILDDGYSDDYSGYETPAPVDAAAVMPAGQPGAYEVHSAPVDASAVIPAGQPGGPALAPTATVDDGAWTMSGPGVDSGLYPSVATIGGNPFGGPTIEVGAEDPALGQTVMTIGPSDPSSMGNSLASLYGLAADQGDIMSQILITKTLDSMNAATAIWTI
jgi:hypothetical protein